MKRRDIRYQAAIIQDDKVLLIKHSEAKSGRSYWILPGGGIEPDETEEECVLREVKEETNLEVNIKSLLTDEPSPADSVYYSFKTYLCEPVKGNASPGYEPEPGVADFYSITDVKWFDLHGETDRNPEITSDPITYNQMQNLRKKLGYLT